MPGESEEASLPHGSQAGSRWRGRCQASEYDRMKDPTSRSDPPPVPKPVEMSICTDGPIYVHGSVVLALPAGESTGTESRLALCRCGASDSKPFCDNSHSNAEFRDSGSFDRESSADGRTDGSLTVTPLPNGPVLLRGPFVLTSADGACGFRGDKAALCRCGESEKRPFCDGAHARIGSQSD
jgi:CDGSH-type Zn-finger protein